jgi:hypothetical protein
MFSNPDEVIKYLKDEGVKFVDVRFCDLPGVMQHFTVPAETVDANFFTEGVMFDGSSIRGFQAIHESDMQLLADVTSARLDPFRKEKTLNINFFIHDPLTGEQYSRDPRNVAKKAEAYLKGIGVADTAYFGPEAEFYVFDDVRFETKVNTGSYFIDSEAGWWNTGREEPGGNQAYKVRYKGGYFPVPPVDHYADLRDEIVLALQGVGFTVERAHHEVGTAGQAEINYKFNTLLAAADDVMLFKYVVKNVAWGHGKTATFMPKPLFGDNGSGMHTPPEPVEGRHAAVLRRDRLRRPVRHRALLHRRPAAPRPEPAGLHQPDGQLLPPPRPRLRGPGEPGLLPAQPLGLHPDPDHRLEPEGQAHRVPRPRPVLEPVPRLLRDADGRPRRHQEQDRAASPRSTRTSTSSPRTSTPPSPRSRLPPRRPRGPRRGPRLPHRRRRLHPRPDRDLDRLQAVRRDRPDPPAPPPPRVRALLRHLDNSSDLRRC